MSTSRTFMLKSSDNEIFVVEEAVARESETIGLLIDAVSEDADVVIPLPNVTGRIMSKVIQYCKKHVEANQSDDIAAAREDLKNFDADFVGCDQGTLFDIILAANYLNIKSLLDLTCQTVADTIKGKTPEQIRRMFNIVNDFSAEEEEEIRKQHAWAFT